jgi:hypothetical protein
MDRLRPKYVTYDFHGTLINFQMTDAPRDLYGHLLDGPRRHDLMSAYGLGIKSKVWVSRGHEPANPYCEYTESAM